MLHPQALIQLFDYNMVLVERQIAGISHEQSLLQPPNTPNSLNWLLGHLVSSQTRALVKVQAQPVWPDAVRARYRSGSLPITAEGDGVLRFEVILSAFRLSHERLIYGLSQLSYEQMCEKSDYGDNTIGQSLAYFHFHETYHIGQIADVSVALGNPAVWL